MYVQSSKLTKVINTEEQTEKYFWLKRFGVSEVFMLQVLVIPIQTGLNNKRDFLALPLECPEMGRASGMVWTSSSMASSRMEVLFVPHSATPVSALPSGQLSSWWQDGCQPRSGLHASTFTSDEGRLGRFALAFQVGLLSFTSWVWVIGSALNQWWGQENGMCDLAS